MSPQTLTTSPEWVAWQECHRCPICDGLPTRIKNEMVETYITLRPEYRYLAAVGAHAEPWQTEHHGGQWLMEVECENGHVLSGRHEQWRD